MVMRFLFGVVAFVAMVGVENKLKVATNMVDTVRGGFLLLVLAVIMHAVMTARRWDS